MYHEDQHTDAIQLWTEVDGLVIDSCVLGTWQPGGHQDEIGPTQCIMAGTVPQGSGIEFTVQNTLFLGTGQEGGVAINTARSANARIDVTLINNTFWSARPQLNSVSRAYLRNNLFREFRLYPVNLRGIDSDYNAYCWATGPGVNNVPASEGSHSLGTTYGSRVVPWFGDADMGAASGWGRNVDYRPPAGSVLVGAGDASAAPERDINGVRRNPGSADIGAFSRR